MQAHRLTRLSRLTQGAVLVGLGVAGAAACHQRMYINSPPSREPVDPDLDAGTDGDAEADAAVAAPEPSVLPPSVQMPHTNSTPGSR